ncbi:MAG: hypothetical protein ACD_20C00124G0016 [uncultured bacterium]|nr:MAG: hypothetical protein ACD_20C00124G0016 [uncultured bacterium]
MKKIISIFLTFTLLILLSWFYGNLVEAQTISNSKHSYNQNKINRQFQRLNEEVAKRHKKIINTRYSTTDNGSLNIYQAIKIEQNKMDKAYNQFLTDKTNMGFNIDLYNQLISYSKDYSRVSAEYRNLFMDLYNKYYITGFPVKNYYEYLAYARVHISEFDNYLKFCDQIDSTNKKYRKYAEEIKLYSLNYERIRIKNDTGAKTCSCSLEAELLEQHTNLNSTCVYPLYGGYYGNAVSDDNYWQALIGIKVIQSLAGGILAEKPYDYMLGDSKPFFIETKKQFADGEMIRQQMYLVYSGYYTYRTVLGASKKVWKFKEVENHENRKYYFINNIEITGDVEK